MSTKAKAVTRSKRANLLLERVLNGDKYTTRQWAEELFPELEAEKGINRVTSYLATLRRNGVMLFCIPPATGGAGIVEYVNEDETKFSWAFGKVANRMESALKSVVLVGGVLVANHKDTKAAVTARTATLLSQTQDASNYLLDVKYEPVSYLPAAVEHKAGR